MIIKTTTRTRTRTRTTATTTGHDEVMDKNVEVN